MSLLINTLHYCIQYYWLLIIIMSPRITPSRTINRSLRPSNLTPRLFTIFTNIPPFHSSEFPTSHLFISPKLPLYLLLSLHHIIKPSKNKLLFVKQAVTAQNEGFCIRTYQLLFFLYKRFFCLLFTHTSSLYTNFTTWSPSLPLLNPSYIPSSLNSSPLI